MPKSLPVNATTRTVPESSAGGGAIAGVGATSFDTDVAIVPNDTLILRWFAPGAITVTAIKLYAQTAPVSVAGTYLFDITGAGNNLLGAATSDP